MNSILYHVRDCDTTLAWIAWMQFAQIVLLIMIWCKK